MCLSQEFCFESILLRYLVDNQIGIRADIWILDLREAGVINLQIVFRTIQPDEITGNEYS